MTQDQQSVEIDPRAAGYDSAMRAWWYRRVVERAADAAMAAAPVPLRVLDVGCGTGALLQELVVRVPNVLELVGVDPAADLVAIARTEIDPRVGIVQAAVEKLPFPDEHFDLIVSTLSFDDWADQSQGLTEIARILQPAGQLVLVDLSAGWLSVLFRRERTRTRTPRRIVGLIEDTGLTIDRRETVYRFGPLPLVRAFIASR